MKYNIENDKKEIGKLFQKYVQIILKEYPLLIPKDIKERLNTITDFSNYVHIENSGTISLYATPNDGIIHLPTDAYDVINTFSKFSQYGTNRNHLVYNNKNMIINDNTFNDFVEHIIVKGATPLEYFKEILLHEVMHICGSNGYYAISEGFNELKTRELAKKYELETSCCGYPKEIKIAYNLQEIFGKEIGNILAFSNLITGYNLLKVKFNEDAANLYMDVYLSMEKEFRPYMDKKYPGIDGIRKKCLEYDKINYQEALDIINNYKLINKNNINKK